MKPSLVADANADTGPRARPGLWWITGMLVLLSGILLGIAVPNASVIPFVWTITFVPLFLALDRVLYRPGSPLVRWLKVLGCTWPVGLLMGGITGDWVAYAFHTFGGISWLLAEGVRVLGYGTLISLEIFGSLGVPFVLTWKRPRLALLFVPLWATVFQVFVPRFFFWSYGQLMFSTPQLVQIADVLGSGGLNFWLLPVQLLLFAWLRGTSAPGAMPRRWRIGTSVVLVVAFGASAAYGAWRMAELAQESPHAKAVQLVGIQPNFSLQDLATAPDQARVSRPITLNGMIADSNRALTPSLAPEIPVVLVWPESTYRVPYFDGPTERRAVEAWVRALGVHLVLATLDGGYTRAENGRWDWQRYGAAVHVAPEGTAPEVYHKVTLVPFGETVPFAGMFPFLAQRLRAWIPHMSDYGRGHDAKVFTIVPGVKLAPMICFDVTNFHVAQDMTRNGANVGLVLANLAWFGPTTASVQFEYVARFRAIENRIPILVLSQSGQSVLIDDRGQPASPRLDAFKAGVLSVQVPTAPTPSVYARNGTWIEAFYGVALMGVLLGWIAVSAWRHQWQMRTRRT